MMEKLQGVPGPQQPARLVAHHSPAVRPAPKAARGPISRTLEGHYRAVSGMDQNHAEQKAGDVQGRYDRQQGVYARNVFLKRKLSFQVKKSNQKFGAIVRNFRRALTDMRRAQNTRDPVFISASVGRLLQCGGDVTSSVHEILGLATGVKTLDGEIGAVANLVDKDELDNSTYREQLSSHTLMKASLRTTEELSAAPHLEVGHFERDWAAATSRDALDVLQEGVKMMETSLREHNEQAKQKALGKADATPHAKDGSFSQYEVGLKNLNQERGRLEQVLKALTG